MSDAQGESISYSQAVDSTYSIYSGVDHLGTVGKVAPGLFAQEGRCWRMVYEKPVGQGGHCMEPVTWVGRWNILDGLDQGVELRAARRRARGCETPTYGAPGYEI